MTARTHIYDFQQSSEAGRERHLQIPYARQKDATPTLGDPVCVTSRIVGMEICGTVITINATTSEATINFAEAAIFRHNVRNVLTYNVDGPPQTEATWGAINVGDPVFYDENQDALNGVKLSTAQFEGDGTTPNPRFGTIVMMQDQCADDFPTVATALTDVYGVMQTGLNNSY